MGYQPFPSMASVNGNITTQNLVPAGTATANSAVELTLDGAGGVVVQVTGTYTGALSIQATLNGTTWVTLAGTPILNLNTGGYLAVITSALQSIFSVAVGGFLRMRVTGLAAMTGTASVTIKAVPSPLQLIAGAPLPTGSNTIGAVTGSGNFAVTVGASTTSIAKAEDAVAANADVGVPAMGVRKDNLSTDTSASGDYAMPAQDRFGAWLTRDVMKQMRNYVATVIGLAPAATPTDIVAIFGNGTTTVRVLRITITGTQTTAGLVRVDIVKRSAANTGGTSAAMTAIPLDAADAAASSTPVSYTANPTPGAAVGAVKAELVPIGQTTGLTPKTVFEFGDRGKEVILSGTAQGLAINLAGVTLTGGALTITIEWAEF